MISGDVAIIIMDDGRRRQPRPSANADKLSMRAFARGDRGVLIKIVDRVTVYAIAARQPAQIRIGDVLG
ncbi:MAG: hypothetical protein DHS20C05_13960 [Hyphococcus sp.]|nr:MAG: hypothetical protein DHS20C05_13960 [Marinicaulis sp.]